MPAKNPRVSSVVDGSLLAWLRTRARDEGLTVSAAVRDILVRVRAEDEERHWAAEGEQRLASFVREEATAHEDAWK